MRGKLINRIGAFTLGAMLLSMNPASAGLIGATVDVSANFPTVGTVFSDGGNKVVSNAIEYPAGSFPTYQPVWQVNITDNQFILTATSASGFPFTGASFNGFILTVL